MVTADSDGFFSSDPIISEDGKYCRNSMCISTAGYKSMGKGFEVDKIISAEELAFYLYLNLENVAHYSRDSRFKEAMEKDDYDETVFLYFSYAINCINGKLKRYT